MNEVLPAGPRSVCQQLICNPPTTYITPHLGANPTLATYMATPLLAFNLRIAAYLLTLTLAGAVTHSPPPILAAADVDVDENIVLQILQ